MKDILRDSLRTVLNARSIAIIGASEYQNKIGGARGLVSAAGARTRLSGGRSLGRSRVAEGVGAYYVPSFSRSRKRAYR